MIKCSCRGCENRTIDCHVTCEDYKAYTKALSEKRQIECKKRSQENAAEKYAKTEKNKRLKNWKW